MAIPDYQSIMLPLLKFAADKEVSLFQLDMTTSLAHSVEADPFKCRK